MADFQTYDRVVNRLFPTDQPGVNALTYFNRTSDYNIGQQLAFYFLDSTVKSSLEFIQQFLYKMRGSKSYFAFVTHEDPECLQNLLAVPHILEHNIIIDRGQLRQFLKQRRVPTLLVFSYIGDWLFEEHPLSTRAQYALSAHPVFEFEKMLQKRLRNPRNVINIIQNLQQPIDYEKQLAHTIRKIKQTWKKTRSHLPLEFPVNPLQGVDLKSKPLKNERARSAPNIRIRTELIWPKPQNGESENESESENLTEISVQPNDNAFITQPQLSSNLKIRRFRATLINKSVVEDVERKFYKTIYDEYENQRIPLHVRKVVTKNERSKSGGDLGAKLMLVEQNKTFRDGVRFNE
ncbi:Conserved_hypothetical protein [Hexamita inflata]|uniref:Uncharacterized protein n=1 Tax=Hexamita inflata TaxID=28002 RepID=A0AA86R0A8_9EUKA|nr:Conserved hypothetical protein [Hexamita inflata]